MKILLIENDKSVVRIILRALTQQNYAVDIATDGQLGWEFVEAFDYSLILLNTSLPKLDGINFCRQLRRLGYRIPVLLLMAQNVSADKVIGLEAGADDCISGPFDLQELVARVRALLRRGIYTLPPILEWGYLRLDQSTCGVSYQGQPIHLTSKEYSLLRLFLNNSSRLFTYDAIINYLWTSEDPPGEETVRSHIKGLRRKLKAVGSDTNLIETVHGVGYRLKPLSCQANQPLVHQCSCRPDITAV